MKPKTLRGLVVAIMLIALVVGLTVHILHRQAMAQSAYIILCLHWVNNAWVPCPGVTVRIKIDSDAGWHNGMT